MPQISVIIPVYNVEVFLDKCMDSVLNQTFTDFEILLIDDGSTDTSGSICDKYARADKRVKVFHQKNGGVSAARNVGLKAAVGEWITFIDPDDYVSGNFLLGLSASINDDIDLVIGGYLTFSADGISSGLTFLAATFVGEDIRRIFSETNFINFGQPWGKLFRTEIIKREALRFDTALAMSEDRLFLYDFMNQAAGITFLPVNAYYYNTAGGLSKKTQTCHQEIYRLNALCTSANKLKEKFSLSNIEYKPIFVIHLSILMGIVNNCYRIDSSMNDRLKFIKEIHNKFINDNELVKQVKLKEVGISCFLFINRCYLLFDFCKILSVYIKERSKKKHSAI